MHHHRLAIVVSTVIALIIAISVTISAHGTIVLTHGATASIQVTDTRICMTVHEFVPDSYAGFIIRYISKDQTIMRSAYANVIEGRIDLANPNLYLYEVGEAGNVRSCFSRHIITGGSSGLILISAASTEGDLVTAEVNL